MTTQPYDPSSLEAWGDPEVKTVAVSSQSPDGKPRAVKVKVADVLGIMSDDSVSNPLTGLFMKLEEGKNTGKGVDVSALLPYVGGVNRFILQVVVSPPLKENGHDNGISVNAIPFADKMDIIRAMMGGQYSEAERFLPEQTEDVEHRSDGEAVREATIRDADDTFPTAGAMGGRSG